MARTVAMHDRVYNSSEIRRGESTPTSLNDVSAFPSTQWTMVLRAGTASDAQAHAALESLCRRYWYPLYSFVRRQGRDHHEAEDCTQEFLARLLAAEGLQRVRPEGGRFRTFLLSCLRNFLTNEWIRSNTAKRRGGLTSVPLASTGYSDGVSREMPDPGLTPEQAFDLSWATSILDRAVHELRTEYQSSGREKIFETMAPLIWATESNESLIPHAAAAGVTVNAFTVALHRARRRLGDRLRAAVAETVADPTEIDSELRHLVSALSAPNSGK
jgi:RNA polymerase sigma factor (sigma-70 family)